MKNKLLLPLLFLLINVDGFCRVIRISNTGNTFNPRTITIDAGDSVEFALGATHDAVEVSKSTWDAMAATPLANGFSTPFRGGLVLPEKLGVGTHYYVCTPHAEMGMLGTIVVNNVTSTSNKELSLNFSLYPNPITDLLSIQSPSEVVGSFYTITDQAGKEVANGTITNEIYKTNVSTLPNGIYFFQIDAVKKRSFKFVKN